MPTPPNDLVAAIQGATSDTQLQEALLFGAYGESGWNVNSGGPAAGGYWGFTSPYYDSATLWDAPASQQVQAILPSYISAEGNLPAGLSGSSATEWLALQAEAPAFSTPATIAAYQTTVSGDTEYQLGYAYTPGITIPPGGISQEQVIQATGQPTQYGANASFSGGLVSSIYSDITNALGTPDTSPTATQPFDPLGRFPNVSGLAPSSPTPSFVNPGGQETPADAQEKAQAILLSMNAQDQKGFAKQAAVALAKEITLPSSRTTADANNQPTKQHGWTSDLGRFFGFDFFEHPPNLISEAERSVEHAVVSGAESLWNVVKTALVRIGIGIAGLLLMAGGLYIIISKVSGGGMPVPIPV